VLRFADPTDHPFRRAAALLAAALVATLLLSAKAEAAIVVGPVTPPAPPAAKGVVGLAKRELSRNVAERKSNNVPRYRRGKGRIAPYSIRDQWCVAFATWIWGRAGYSSYLETKFLRTSFSGDLVAIQVRDLSRWAKKYGHWSTRAKPGYLVAYGKTHMGIVTKADREGRAVKSIEGNKTDSVAQVTISMPYVTGYISPVPLTGQQASKMRSLRPDL
jgi:hypothetical protein